MVWKQAGGLTESEWKIIWNLQNEILSGKWKDTALHQKQWPTQTQSGEELVQQQFGTEDLEVIQAKYESTLRQSGNLRSGAYKTQPTTTTEFKTRTSAELLFPALDTELQGAESPQKSNNNGERPKNILGEKDKNKCGGFAYGR